MNFQDFILSGIFSLSHTDSIDRCVSGGDSTEDSVSPELLLHLLQCVARDNKHLIHVVSQHVTGVADVHRCF